MPCSPTDVATVAAIVSIESQAPGRRHVDGRSAMRGSWRDWCIARSGAAGVSARRRSRTLWCEASGPLCWAWCDGPGGDAPIDARTGGGRLSARADKPRWAWGGSEGTVVNPARRAMEVLTMFQCTGSANVWRDTSSYISWGLPNAQRWHRQKTMPALSCCGCAN